MALADRIDDTHGEDFWYLDVEGISRRLTTHPEPAGWTTPGGRTAMEGALQISSIKQPSESVKPADPIASVGGLDFELVDDSTGTLANLFAFFLTTRAETYMTAALTKTAAAAINVASTADFAAAGDAYCGLETTAYTAKAALQLQNLTRGRYGSQQLEHSYVSAWGEGEIVTDHPTLWRGRRVKLYRNWLKPDGTAIDADYGGAHEELRYTGRIVEIKQGSNQARRFTILTNSLIADLNRPVCAHRAESEWSPIGLWLEGVDSFDCYITQVGPAASTTRRFGTTRDTAVSAWLGGNGPYTMAQVARAIADELDAWFTDGAWVGGNLAGQLRMRSDGHFADSPDVHVWWEYIGAGEPLQIVMPVVFEGPAGGYVLHAFGFRGDVLGSVGDDGGVQRVGSEAEEPVPRFYWHVRQTRLYCMDLTDFVADQGVDGRDDAKAYVLLDSPEGKALAKIEGVNTAGLVGSHYLEISTDPGDFQRQHDWGPGFLSVVTGKEPPKVRQALRFWDGQQTSGGEAVGPLESMLYLFMSSGTAAHNDAVYDQLPIPRMGLDTAAEDIDVDSFAAAAVEIPVGIEYDAVLAEATPFAEWAKPLLTAMGGLITMRRGVLTFRSWAQAAPLVDADAPTLDHSYHVAAASQTAGLKEGITGVAWSLGRNPVADKWSTDQVLIPSPYGAESSGVRALEIKVPSYWLRLGGAAADDGVLQALAELSSWLLSILGLPLPTISLQTSRRASDVWVGDVVTVTLRGAWDPRAGTYDYTARLFQVLSQSFDEGSGVVQIDAMSLDGRGFQIGPYAPEGLVTAYAAGPPVVLTISANAFSLPTSADGSAQVDADFFERLVDGDTTVNALVMREGHDLDAGNVSITAVSGNDLTLAAAPAFPIGGGAPVAGDRVRLQDWDAAAGTTAQEHAHQADAAAGLGAAPDGPFYWSEVGGRM